MKRRKAKGKDARKKGRLKRRNKRIQEKKWRKE
jgi:hypothetical protein